MATILYAEDNPDTRKSFLRLFKVSLPSDKIIPIDGLEQGIAEVQKIGGPKNIDLICTDGDLEGSKGWDLVENLIELGYQGKAIYVGGAIIPKRKEYLFVNPDPLAGDELIETIKKYTS